MATRDDTASFIVKANAVHGERYDYSSVQYVRSTEPVVIICQKHGQFKQKPNKHLQGRGCCGCAEESRASKRTKPTEQFIEEAKRVHSDLYGYHLVEYVSARAKIEIVCSVHGSFWQVADSHLKGFGCQRCGSANSAALRTKTQAQFIADAIAVHGNRYCYDEVEYSTGKQKVAIICREHGIFWQVAQSHTSGDGCLLCKESSGERMVADSLSSAGLIFEREKSFPGLKRKSHFVLISLFHQAEP